MESALLQYLLYMQFGAPPDIRYWLDHEGLLKCSLKQGEFNFQYRPSSHNGAEEAVSLNRLSVSIN